MASATKNSLQMSVFALLVLPTLCAALPAWMQQMYEMLPSPLHRSARAALNLSNQRGSFDMILLHTNDMHARFEQTNRLSGVCSSWEAEHQKCYGGYARIATMLRKDREAAENGGPPVLALSAGDTYQGTLYYTLFKSEVAVKFTNLLGFDAQSLGNHEFDDGPAGLAPFLKNIRVPTLGANVDFSKSEALKDINLPPSMVFDVRGHKVGVIGYLTPETRFLSSLGDVIVTEEIEAIKKEAQKLTDQGVKIIIALGHSGYLMDQKIAAAIPELDLVVGGHSHTFLFNNTVDPLPDSDVPSGPYPTIVTQRSGKKVPVVQASAFTKYIGRLHLSFDDDGELTSIEGKPILLDKNVPEDPEVLHEVNIWKQKLENYTSKVEGSSLVLLDFSECRYAECNLGNLISDAYVYYRATSPARKSGPGWTDAPIAFLNGGSIRTSIDARTKNGSVSLRDILDVLPFGNLLTVVKVSGEVLLQMLEHGVRRYDPNLADNKGGFPQVSGLEVTFNIARPPGSRVVEVSTRCGDCDKPAYSPLDIKKSYTILVNSFMVDGGDGYDMIATGEVTTLDDMDNQVVVKYMNEQSPVYPEISGRIKITMSGATANQISGLVLVPTIILLRGSFAS